MRNIQEKQEKNNNSIQKLSYEDFIIAFCDKVYDIIKLNNLDDSFKSNQEFYFNSEEWEKNEYNNQEIDNNIVRNIPNIAIYMYNHFWDSARWIVKVLFEYYTNITWEKVLNINWEKRKNFPTKKMKNLVEESTLPSEFEDFLLWYKYYKRENNKKVDNYASVLLKKSSLFRKKVLDIVSNLESIEKIEYIRKLVRNSFEDLAEINAVSDEDWLNYLNEYLPEDEKIHNTESPRLFKQKLFRGEKLSEFKNELDSLTNNDYVFWNHRSHGYYISMWWDINKLMAEIYWKEDWCSKWRWWSMHIADVKKWMMWSTAIVAWTISLALWAALSCDISNDWNVAVTFFWDGAVNEWVIFESINFAVLKKLPIIFVCENNLYATHVPINSHLSNTNISELVKWFNIESIRVDWNNVTELKKQTEKLISKARNWEWPIFIECLTYRHRWHVWPNYDTDKWLRTINEVNSWMEKCPIEKIKNDIINKNIWKENELQIIYEEVNKEINESVDYAHKSWEINKDNLLNLVFNN